ncbi:O-antigen ligase family protein [Porticoccaceae bacterium nBUS_09]
MNSNDLGCLSTALMAFFLCLRRSPFGVAFSILFVVLSGSRVFLVVATLLLILFAARESGSFTRRWASFAIIAVSAFGLVLVYIDPILMIMSRGDDTQLYTLHGRTFYWGLGLAAFIESPIFGSGFYVTHRFMDYLMPSYGFSSPTFDNSFLDVAAGTGLIGLSLYIGLFFWMFRKSMSLRDDGLRRFFFASTIILLARGLTGPGLVVYGHIFIYFIFVVMSLGKVESNEIRT